MRHGPNQGQTPGRPLSARQIFNLLFWGGASMPCRDGAARVWISQTPVPALAVLVSALGTGLSGSPRVSLPALPLGRTRRHLSGLSWELEGGQSQVHVEVVDGGSWGARDRDDGTLADG